MDKGLAEALAACRDLPEDCCLNVFGPAMSNTDFSLLTPSPPLYYCGVLDPEDVPRVMREHDLLLYPSYSRSEGYPGVILEAFQCGLPVVAAKWGGVTELVEHEENGLLVEPHSVSELKAAINSLIDDSGLYHRLRQGAKRRGAYFRSSNWYDQMTEDLCDLRNRE